MILYEEETGKILKACMNVFNELGNGFLEPVYQEALAIEFRLLDIPFEREKNLTSHTKDIYWRKNIMRILYAITK